MRRRGFLNELDRLRKLNIVTDKAYQDVENYYFNEERVNGVFYNTLITIGSALIGLGIILLFAYNWAAMGRVLKTFILIGTLICSQGIFYFLMFYKKKYVSGASVLLMLISGLSIAMISQMYNVSGNEERFYLTWAVLAIPLLYLSRGNLERVIYGLILYMYANSQGNIVLYLIMGAPLLYLKGKEEKFGEIGDKIAKLIFLSGILFWYGNMGDIPKLAILFYGGFFTLVSLLPLGLEKIGKFFIIILVYMLTFKGGYLSDREIIMGKELFVSGAVYTGVLGYLIYKRGSLRDPLMWNLPLLLIPLFFDWGFIVFNIYFFFFGVLFIYRGVRNGEISIFNEGSLMTGILIITRFLDYQIPTLFRGVVFIILGILLIAGNVWAFRKRGESYEK